MDLKYQTDELRLRSNQLEEQKVREKMECNRRQRRRRALHVYTHARMRGILVQLFPTPHGEEGEVPYPGIVRMWLLDVGRMVNPLTE